MAATTERDCAAVAVFDMRRFKQTVIEFIVLKEAIEPRTPIPYSATDKILSFIDHFEQNHGLRWFKEYEAELTNREAGKNVN